MFLKRIAALVLALLLLPLGLLEGHAAQVSSDEVYCFTAQDFSQEEQPITGICVMVLPEGGTVMLGSRIIRPGDILTASQVEQMTFDPVKSEQDAQAVMTYLPIYENRVAAAATMTISIRGKADNPPVAEDSALETYKNLANDGKLSARDPEGAALIFTVTRQPKRGQVDIRPDGTFTYTPKKNKVGVDSFTYTATDPAGHVSREATVTIAVLKPADATQYTDTAGLSCRFAAEWMKNTGLFEGEQIGGQSCFSPEKTVTQGEFITMLVKALQIPVELEAKTTGFADDAPQWLRPYLAAALRAGLTAGWPEDNRFSAGEPITGAQAAVMLQNALELSVSTASFEIEEELQWAALAVQAMQENGFNLEPGTSLTRAQAALTLYQASLLAETAPGMDLYR